LVKPITFGGKSLKPFRFSLAILWIWGKKANTLQNRYLSIFKFPVEVKTLQQKSDNEQSSDFLCGKRSIVASILAGL